MFIIYSKSLTNLIDLHWKYFEHLRGSRIVFHFVDFPDRELCLNQINVLLIGATTYQY